MNIKFKLSDTLDKYELHHIDDSSYMSSSYELSDVIKSPFNYISDDSFYHFQSRVSLFDIEYAVRSYTYDDLGNMSIRYIALFDGVNDQYRCRHFFSGDNKIYQIFHNLFLSYDRSVKLDSYGIS